MRPASLPPRPGRWGTGKGELSAAAAETDGRVIYSGWAGGQFFQTKNCS